MAETIRASFDSTLTIDKVKITTESIATLIKDETNLNKCLAILNTYGFVVVANSPGKDVTDEEVRQNVLDLKPLFGIPGFHVRADEDGVAKIFNDPNEKLLMFKPGEFDPHTDGTFAKKTDEFLTLTCYKPSEDGGESFILSANAIYEHCKKVLNKDDLEALFRDDAVTYDRAPDFAKKAVFTANPKTGQVGICWRKDLFVNAMDETVHPDAHTGVRAMLAFIEDEKNHVVYKLQRNEVLLCNNTAVLHARHGYPDDQERHLERLNMNTIGSGAILDDGRITPGFKRESRMIDSTQKSPSTDKK